MKEKENNNIIIKDNKKSDLYLDLDKLSSIYDLNKSSSLVLNIVDFDSVNRDISLTFNLDSNSHLELNIICINNLDKTKNYNIVINHNKSDSYSRIKVAGINLKGNISVIASSTVNSGAVNSDTRIEGKIINLNSEARSKISPILYIKENDVKASHGASLGSYNSDDLYYLTSRGITLDDAKKSITYGTIFPLVNNINNDLVKTKSLSYLKGLSI